jgi:malate dehydrogenase (oxaloacetate-decarboxylating)
MHLGGTIEMASKHPIRNRDDLSMVYTPGVARVCMAIAENPEDARRLTIKRNTVAVVTDGSAVLGSGQSRGRGGSAGDGGQGCAYSSARRHRRLAAVPGHPGPGPIVGDRRRHLAGFAGINLEDISAPRCFEIEARLRKLLDVPVFHDDQHGTAIVVLGGHDQRLRVVEKSIEDIRLVMSGAGAAGTAVLKLLLAAGLRHATVVDIKASSLGTVPTWTTPSAGSPSTPTPRAVPAP